MWLSDSVQIFDVFSGNYCNNCLKGGWFPGDINGDFAWGCLSERRANLSLKFRRMFVTPAVVIGLFIVSRGDYNI